VTPLDKGVGQFPATYHFEVIPAGDIYQEAYLLIEMPDEITIYSKRDFERDCGENVSNFTYTGIECKTRDNKIWIMNGFKNDPTNNVTNEENDELDPPHLQFDLVGFRNPRSIETSGNWNVTIFDKFNDELYYWQYEFGPNVTMSGAATPRRIYFDRDSEVNGAITRYNMTVQTTNYLQDED